ncbi:MAG TPA: hypothetical protein VKM54_05820 [Myxococcota bacterium]|nr:hypothetical protein [Myxococcota bacterium]
MQRGLLPHGSPLRTELRGHLAHSTDEAWYAWSVMHASTVSIREIESSFWS